MATSQVGYDLNKPRQNYSDLIEALKSTGTWCHPLDSTWLVVAENTAVGLRDALLQHIDSNDELIVVDVSGDPAAWNGLSGEISGWITTNM